LDGVHSQGTDGVDAKLLGPVDGCGHNSWRAVGGGP
jgi:hypothetical protein